MSSFWWGQSAFDELVEKATSELLPAGQVDLALHLEISDQIRSKKIPAKEAMRAFKQRLDHKNPNVIIATLSLIDTCVKNSGSAFVKQVATRDFMEEMTHLVKMPPGCNQDVKDKVLSLVQVWGIASKGNNSLGYISGTYNLLRAEGYVFPPVTEKIDSILLETAVAPDWTDSDVCERCRTAFTLTNRKHHCRQCGQTFCQQCSSKSLPLPHLGINETVRVCDGCYIKVNLAKVADKETVPQLLATPSSISSSLTPNYAPSIKKPEPMDDHQFEEDLKKALELSKKESDQRKKFQEFIAAPPAPPTAEDEEEEANIAAAIAASLADMKVDQPTIQRDDLSSVDMENIELFSTLMQRVKSSGNDVSGDTQINKLYVQIGALQPKLVKTLNETSKKHDLFVELHNKLNHAVRAYDKLIQDRLCYYSPTQQYNRPISYPVAQPYQPPQTPVQQHQIPVRQQSVVYPTPVQQHAAYSNVQQHYPQPQTPVQQQSYVAYPSIQQQQTPVQQQTYAYPNTQQPVTYPSTPQQQQQPVTYPNTPQQQQTPVTYPNAPQQQQNITYPTTQAPAQQQYQQPQQQQYQQQASQAETSQQPVQQYQQQGQNQYPAAPAQEYNNNYYNYPQQQQQQQPKQIIEEAPLIEL